MIVCMIIFCIFLPIVLLPMLLKTCMESNEIDAMGIWVDNPDQAF